MKKTTLRFTRALSLACLLLSLCGIAAAQGGASPAQSAGNYPTPSQGDYLIRDFKFKSGETLPELRLHYATLGTPTRDSAGVVRNAVLVMHGTGGDYKEQPVRGLTAAVNILLMMTSSPLQWQKQAPTRDAADKFYEERLKTQLARTDANDMLYQFDSSREYDPSPKLETIRAPLIAVNSADDLVNPPELGVMEREIKRVRRGRYVLLPITDETRGHGTHSLPSVWQKHLAQLLEESAR